MNRENIEYMIGIMEEAEALDMNYFQDSPNDEPGYAETIDILHKCGNRACFAGYMAISDKFKQDGGCSMRGAPAISRFHEDEAVAYWLDISEELASEIVFPNPEIFNRKSYSTISPRDVIQVLENILDGEYGEQHYDAA